jgi:hypothetical protein
MKRQIEMEKIMLYTYRQFMVNLEKSISLLSQDIDGIEEEAQIITDEWCLAVEEVLEELAGLIFTLNKPCWLSKKDSKKINGLYQLIHDLYTFMIYVLVSRQSKDKCWEHPLLFLATCDYLTRGNEIYGDVSFSHQEYM